MPSKEAGVCFPSETGSQKWIACVKSGKEPFRHFLQTGMLLEIVEIDDEHYFARKLRRLGFYEGLFFRVLAVDSVFLLDLEGSRMGVAAKALAALTIKLHPTRCLSFRPLLQITQDMEYKIG